MVNQNEFFIPLEKLLQIILAFQLGGFDAFTKKSHLLKINSKAYNVTTEFLKDGRATMNVLIDLWLLFSAFEYKKKNSEDSKTPITYYLIDCFARYNCNNRDVSMIEEQLDNNEKIRNIINLYSQVPKAYTIQDFRLNNIGYNSVIKKAIDYSILDNFIDVFENV